jgi:hypothetical protein
MAAFCWSDPNVIDIETCASPDVVILEEPEYSALIDAALLSNTGLDLAMIDSLSTYIPDPATLAEAWGAGLMVGGIPLVVGLTLGSVLHFIRKN